MHVTLRSSPHPHPPFCFFARIVFSQRPHGQLTKRLGTSRYFPHFGHLNVSALSGINTCISPSIKVFFCSHIYIFSYIFSGLPVFVSVKMTALSGCHGFLEMNFKKRQNSLKWFSVPAPSAAYAVSRFFFSFHIFLIS